MTTTTSAEYTDSEWQEKLKREREEHTKASSPSILERVSNALSGRSQAEEELAKARAKADAEMQRQRHFNVLSSRRDKILATIEKGERTLKDLPSEIEGWQGAVRLHLLEPGHLAQSQRLHAGQQVAILRVFLEELPATLKGLRGEVRAVEKEMEALQKEPS